MLSLRYERPMIESYKNLHPKLDPSAFCHQSAVLIGDVEVGKESSIWPNCTLRGDMGKIRIGNQSSIQDNTVIHMTTNLSSAVVGDRVTVGHNVILHGCIIEDECLIGMGAILLDNCKIGTGSLVAAGSLVTVNAEIPPNSLVMGSPAKVKRPLNEEERKMIDSGWPHYVEVAKAYSGN